MLKKNVLFVLLSLNMSGLGVCSELSNLEDIVIDGLMEGKSRKALSSLTRLPIKKINQMTNDMIDKGKLPIEYRADEKFINNKYSKKIKETWRLVADLLLEGKNTRVISKELNLKPLTVEYGFLEAVTIGYIKGSDLNFKKKSSPKKKKETKKSDVPDVFVETHVQEIGQETEARQEDKDYQAIVELYLEGKRARNIARDLSLTPKEVLQNLQKAAANGLIDADEVKGLDQCLIKFMNQN